MSLNIRISFCRYDSLSNNDMTGLVSSFNMVCHQFPGLVKIHIHRLPGHPVHSIRAAGAQGAGE